MRVRRLGLIGVLLAVALVAAACGGSSKKAGSTSSTTVAANVGTTAPMVAGLGTGVTDKTIDIGVSYVDFDCIKQFVTKVRPNPKQAYEVFINDVNKKGGIAGRQIVPHYEKFCPIPNPATFSRMCTRFSEDLKVFAVIGNVEDPSGAAEECMAKRHNTVLLSFDLTQAIADHAPPGTVIFPGTFPERIDSVLGELLGQQGTLTGKTVGVLGENSVAKVVSDSSVPMLKKIAGKVTEPAILQISGTDTTNAQSQLDAAIQRWKSEKIDALFLTGDNVVSGVQFVRKIRAAFPNIVLVTNITNALTAAQGEQKIGRNPNPYEGIITADGPTQPEYDKSENWAYCVKIYHDALGVDPPNAEANIPLASDPTKLDDTYGGVNDACQIVTLFHDIAERVGQNLNVQNWTNVVDHYGEITNRGGGQFASLHQGKYDIDDTKRLEAYDHTIPPQGNWKPITELKDVSG